MVGQERTAGFVPFRSAAKRGENPSPCRHPNRPLAVGFPSPHKDTLVSHCFALADSGVTGITHYPSFRSNCLSLFSLQHAQCQSLFLASSTGTSISRMTWRPTPDTVSKPLVPFGLDPCHISSLCGSVHTSVTLLSSSGQTVGPDMALFLAGEEWHWHVSPWRPNSLGSSVSSNQARASQSTLGCT